MLRCSQFSVMRLALSVGSFLLASYSSALVSHQIFFILARHKTLHLSTPCSCLTFLHYLHAFLGSRRKDDRELLYMLTHDMSQSCQRCMKAKTMCPGYLDDADLTFRSHYGELNDCSSSQSTVQPWSQKYSPTLSQGPLGHHFINNPEVEQRALATFLDDYCIVSKDKSVSRGYLEDLESLLVNARPSTDLARAVKIVALASLGNKLDDQNLALQAHLIYSNLLCSFQVTLATTTTSNAFETLNTAILLGLYEVYLPGL